MTSPNREPTGPSWPFLLRIFDVIGAGVLLLIGLIPMGLIALAIRANDGGPALFRQVRVGRNRENFEILKFRSMRFAPDAPATRAAVSTEVGDSRITGIGRVLRPTHLDEMPQLLNVLCGDMSFVGVRPDTPMQEGDYPAEHWHARHIQRPGITGPSQLIRGEVTMPMRIAAERKWIEGASVRMYWSVLFRTVGKVLSRTSS